MSRSETAVNKFKEGFNCAQSVLYSYAGKLGLSTDTALKVANGFGAGMGRKQETCGAVSGAVLVLSLIYGRGEHDDRQVQDYNYARIRELIDRFEAEFGTIYCKKLLGGCELLTPEGQKLFKSENMIEQCYGYVDFTVKVLEEITG